MSRIGRKPIAIPAGVEIKIEDNLVSVKGPNGSLSTAIHKNIAITVEGSEINVTRPNDDKDNKALHGLSRTLISNMVDGVTKGFKKELDVNGVGYRVSKQGKALVMNL
ncbi:MAG: 50S ribosomal protein L6, partial [Clostridiales bacterium 43-6]